MDRIKVGANSTERLEVEIVPKKEQRNFGGVLAFVGLASLAYVTYEFAPLNWKAILPLLPFWLVCIVFILMGWNNWVWCSRGSERITVSSGKLLYERSGSFLDRKKKELNVHEITKIIVLWFGVGDSGLQLKARSGNLFLGRNLSKSEGRDLVELLRPFLPALLPNS